MNRKRRSKLDDIILTMAAYPHMNSRYRREYAIGGLLLLISEYLTWAA